MADSDSAPADPLVAASVHGESTATGPLLALLASCADCGACCREQGAPPDYVALTVHPEFASEASFQEDAARLAALPAAARELLDLYFRETAAGVRPENGTCVWFCETTRGCRFYELRPSTCRVFELDSPGCHIYRRRQGIT